MKNTFLLAVCLMLSAGVAGQQRPERQVAARIAEHKAHSTFTQSTPFVPSVAPDRRDALVGAVVEDASFLTVSAATLAGLLVQQPEQLTLAIPTAGGTIELDLVRAEILSTGFSMVTAGAGAPVDQPSGMHYRGIVAGQPHTLAAISIFPEEVMGFVSDATGNHVLGKLEGSADEHIYYAERDLLDPPVIECTTPDGTIPSEPRPVDHGAARTARCVDLYWEVDHAIYQDKGGLTNTTNYITGLFNQHATLFDNDGISVVLSELFIWDVPSPYTGTTTEALLTQFQGFRNGYNGDVGHLLGYGGGGGLAVFDGLCAANPDHRMCYSSIHTNYASVPVYSFSVVVVTHEEGHVMGSPHTHACAWNGNNTAIDGCGPSEGYPYEGACSGAPIPADGGTVMSYCHLTPVGVDFNHGFGPQPAALIIGKVNSAPCLGSCGAAGCDFPADIASDAQANSATVSWTAVGNADSYTVQWKAATTANWITEAGITATEHGITSLFPGVTYNYRVRTACAGGPSAFSPVYAFTTPCTLGAPCDDGNAFTENDVIVSDCVCAGTPPSTFQEIDKVVANDRAELARFGQSVAISGDHAIVGAIGDKHYAFGNEVYNAGAAYIFVRSGSSWVQQQKIVASDRSESAEFGVSVAISGDLAIVGAHRAAAIVPGEEFPVGGGAAYIFVRNGNTWTQQQKITASDAATLDRFGGSVAITADHAIVGAPQEDGNGFTSVGAAYIFVRNGSTWTQQQKVLHALGDQFDLFGNSVAMSGDQAIVGCPGFNYNGNRGAAFILKRNGNTWSQLRIQVSPATYWNSFGQSVAMDGDQVIVGAPGEDEVWNQDLNIGAAYIFVKNGNAWSQQQRIVASDRQNDDGFGQSVAISGDHAIVGAQNEDHDATGGDAFQGAGSAYTFIRRGTTWTELQKVVASDRAAGDEFAVSVAMDGDHALIGAYLEDEDVFGTNTLWDAGSAYFLANDTAQVSLSVKLWLEGPYDPATQRMNDALRALPSFPLLEPYSGMGFTNAGGGGGENTNAGVLAASGNNAVVDWVRIELRSSDDPTVIIATRHGLLQSDGDVVSASNGMSPLLFNVTPGNYHVAVRHRNHLGCMTGTAVALGPAVNALDFRNPATATYGTDARKNINGSMALWAGYCTGDDVLSYMGTNNDRDAILVRIGGAAPHATVAGYYLEDVNLNGTVKYVGRANDREPILVNIGGNTPDNERLQQLP